MSAALPRNSRTANLGVGSTAGRPRIRPRVWANSSWRTGLGAVALRGPDRDWSPSACWINPTWSATWIHDCHCLPPPRGPPRPSRAGIRSFDKAPPSLERTIPVRNRTTRCRIRCSGGLGLPLDAHIGEEVGAGRRRFVNGVVSGPVEADGAGIDQRVNSVLVHRCDQSSGCYDATGDNGGAMALTPASVTDPRPRQVHQGVDTVTRLVGHGRGAGIPERRRHAANRAHGAAEGNHFVAVSSERGDERLTDETGRSCDGNLHGFIRWSASPRSYAVLSRRRRGPESSTSGRAHVAPPHLPWPVRTTSGPVPRRRYTRPRSG